MGAAARPGRPSRGKAQADRVEVEWRSGRRGARAGEASRGRRRLTGSELRSRRRKSLRGIRTHYSRILVSPGPWVGGGQLIGRVGTRASRGHHPHFEVRLDGDPVDPSRWLCKLL